ncbi:hypothetical protein PIIN_09810 [Serendipita indica DSM 11827]|uniref:Uncharacterized protein n=1 Tax=Serendipita indica (strain DSM 11827) TaxID=1109443 RepID=G4TWX9_SERID|nr:hypothetical protein PIIN_09810 [Serendipita indica DSM 11827]
MRQSTIQSWSRLLRGCYEMVTKNQSKCAIRFSVNCLLFRRISKVERHRKDKDGLAFCRTHQRDETITGC